MGKTHITLCNGNLIIMGKTHFALHQLKSIIFTLVMNVFFQTSNLKKHTLSKITLTKILRNNIEK